MVVDLVTFRVKSGRQADFERHCEDWARLLRRSRGFIGQVLLRNVEDPTEYRAEVRWVSREYRDRFAGRQDAETQALLKASATLLESAPGRTLLEAV
jgi:heme-degrading monooxygenase HmoA